MTERGAGDRLGAIQSTTSRSRTCAYYTTNDSRCVAFEPTLYCT
ncbi:hypothetical protein WMF11_37710 [Sorangium sp. So ce295]